MAEDWSAERFVSGLQPRLAETLADGPSVEGLDRCVVAAAAAADEVCRARPLACGPGCPHCCVLNVAVLLPEAARIAGWLEGLLPLPELAQLQRRLHEHRRWARWMEDEERIARKAYCPFLDDNGNCAIHPVRPLSCRGVASLDQLCCVTAFDPIISEQDHCVPADLLRRAAHDAAFATLAEVLRRNGLQDRSIELGTGVLAFLEHPDFRERYQAGESLPRELWG